MDTSVLKTLLCDLGKPRQPQLMLMSWQILLLIWQTTSMSPVNLSTGKGK